MLVSVPFHSATRFDRKHTRIMSPSTRRVVHNAKPQLKYFIHKTRNVFFRHKIIPYNDTMLSQIIRAGFMRKFFT